MKRFRRENPANPPPTPGGAGGNFALRAGRRGEWWLLVPGLGNGLEIAIWAPLFWVPVGSPIRPMGAALLMFLIAGATLLLGGAVAVQLFAERGYTRAVVCLLTSFSPLLVAVLVISLAMQMRRLTLSD